MLENGLPIINAFYHIIISFPEYIRLYIAPIGFFIALFIHVYPLEGNPEDLSFLT